MKLYYLPGACPLAAHIALEWIGQPYQIEEVPRDQLKQPAFLAKNPLGSVPVLEDGELTLTQSSAILEYLAERHPEAGLMPDTIAGRAEVRRWLGICNADIHRSFGNIFAAPSFVSAPETQQELISKTSDKLKAYFGAIDRHMQGRQWLAATRSIADPYLYTVMRWAKLKQVDLSNMKNLQAFFGRMEAEPAVQAALKAQGLS